jgi:hypothetical protein
MRSGSGSLSNCSIPGDLEGILRVLVRVKGVEHGIFTVNVALRHRGGRGHGVVGNPCPITLALLA